MTSKEDEIHEMIDKMYQKYIENGFDFSTSDTFDEIFKRIFTDAVINTLKVLDEEDA